MPKSPPSPFGWYVKTKSRPYDYTYSRGNGDKGTDPNLRRLALKVLDRHLRDACRTRSRRNDRRTDAAYKARVWWEQKWVAYRWLTNGHGNGFEDWCNLAGVRMGVVREELRRRLADDPTAHLLGWLDTR